MKLSKKKARELAAEMLERQDETDKAREAYDLKLKLVGGIPEWDAERQARNHHFEQGWGGGWQNGFERAIRAVYGSEAVYQVVDAYEALERERGTWPSYRVRPGIEAFGHALKWETAREEVLEWMASGVHVEVIYEARDGSKTVVFDTDWGFEPPVGHVVTRGWTLDTGNRQVRTEGVPA